MKRLTVVARYSAGPSHNYPRVRLSDGRIIREHRWVMEQYLGRPLKSSEHVHHEDENPLNNQLSNLELTTRSAHAKLHAKPAPEVEIKCPKCGISFIRSKRYVRSKKRLKQRKIFCSRSCSRKDRFTGKKVITAASYTCGVCRGSFNLPARLYRLRKKRNKSGDVACSRSCGQTLRQRVRGV